MDDAIVKATIERMAAVAERAWRTAPAAVGRPPAALVGVYKPAHDYSTVEYYFTIADASESSRRGMLQFAGVGSRRQVYYVVPSKCHLIEGRASAPFYLITGTASDAATGHKSPLRPYGCKLDPGGSDMDARALFVATHIAPLV